MTKERLQYLLEKYLDDSATPAERAEYDAWYEQAVSKGEDFFTEVASPTGENFKRELFNNISQHIMPARPERMMGRKILMIGKWAAAAGVMLISFRFLLFHPSTGVVKKASPAVVIVSDNIVRIGNSTSAVREISLKDGSVVRLYPNSELSYWPSFGTKDRKVYLSGKAFFEAAKDRSRPFTVYSRDLSTVALGTSFTVTAWPDADHIEVVLHTGRVMIGRRKDTAVANGKKIYLLPGQQADWNIGNDIATVRTITTGRHDDSRNKDLSYGERTGFAISFDQTPLSEVLDSIGQGYGVKLNFKKETLSGMIFSGRIRGKDSLAQVLRRIASLHDLEIKPNPGGYSIRKAQ